MVWVVETPQRLNTLSVGHLRVAFVYFLNQSIMNTQEKNLPVLPGNGPTFSQLLVSDFIMRNGAESQVLTFIPQGIKFEEIARGVNLALEATGEVTYVHHKLLNLKDGEIKPSGVIFHPRPIDISRHYPHMKNKK